jgi:hypothetical protein
LAQIFPKWTNKLPVYFVVFILLAISFVTFFFWYYGSPKYTDVGYRPKQPVSYSHKLHAGDLGMDCRYCHTGVEISPVAGVPPTQTCMNCHTLVGTDNTKLLPVRESWASGKPIEWVKVHKLPDYAYFNHSAHLRSGVGCETCHGNVANMEIVELKEPLSMGWCINCHREPEPHLRPQSELTTMNYKYPDNQLEYAAKLIDEKQISPPIDCSGCHR